MEINLSDINNLEENSLYVKCNENNLNIVKLLLE